MGEAVALGRRLHFVSRGAGPAVLLIHGMGAASHSWDRVELPGFRLIAVDLPGCGRSEGELGPQAPTDLATLLGELMRELGHESYSVVGHSLGALIALELALLRPEQVRAAALVDAAVRVSPAARLCNLPALPEVAAGVLEALPVPRALIRLYLRVLFGDRGRITEAAVEAYARTTASPHYLRVQLAQLRGLLAWSAGDRIRIPGRPGPGALGRARSLPPTRAGRAVRPLAAGGALLRHPRLRPRPGRRVPGRALGRHRPFPRRARAAPRARRSALTSPS